MENISLGLTKHAKSREINFENFQNNISKPVSQKLVRKHLHMIPRLAENDPSGSRNILFVNAVGVGIEPGSAWI